VIDPLLTVFRHFWEWLCFRTFQRKHDLEMSSTAKGKHKVLSTLRNPKKQ